LVPRILPTLGDKRNSYPTSNCFIYLPTLSTTLACPRTSAHFPNMDTTVDIGRRIVQMFWDPEPTNDLVRDQPVWCLGSSYKLNNSPSPKREPAPPNPQDPQENNATRQTVPPAAELPETPPDSISSSFDESLAYEEAPRDGGWPPAFLDDFESRIWMTYRSEFDPIPRSQDPKALAALSFSMRLKTQLSDQNGFASDSGWGCMIRSGQSLLGNAIAIQRLGRGKSHCASGEGELTGHCC
jgi:cysteine protease ATG4